MIEIKYIPVEVEVSDTKSGKVEIRYKEDEVSTVDSRYLKTADDLKAEGAEEYKQALFKLYNNMNADEMKKVIGSNSISDMLGMDTAELINILNAYDDKNTPNVGDIWSDNSVNVIVLTVKDGTVYYYNYIEYAYIMSNYICDFIKKYHYTGVTSEHLEYMLNELKADYSINAKEKIGSEIEDKIDNDKKPETKSEVDGEEK